MRVFRLLPGAMVAFLLSACAEPVIGERQTAPSPPPSLLDADTLRAAQPEMMADAVASIRPGVSGQTELFAVLAAWYPDQRVFLREVEQAADILGGRLEAEGRIVTLASSTAEPFRHPLATPANLSAAARHLAARMNPEDVLLVYLTSHGLPGMLVPGTGALRTPPLIAEELDRLLDAAGVSNTVVIISACRSGSFIPVLQSPDRLIITAAAADRNSFCCSDANEWTWFGRAFFAEALGETRHLSEAFARAARLIAEWEAAEGFLPSRPQISEGARIGPALEKLASPRE